MKDKLYQIFPVPMQELMVSLYNLKEYRTRYGGRYREFRDLLVKNDHLSRKELKDLQNQKFLEFLSHTIEKSDYYKEKYAGIDLPKSVKEIGKLPILTKDELKASLDRISTTTDGIVSKTGGTTGFSMKVIYTAENMQERFAFLDHFRAAFGYRLGKKTAWFSGKTLLQNNDLKKNRFWRTDWLHKVRYYSTFHMKNNYLKYYVEDLIKYRPEFFVGFPSTIAEIAKFGLSHGYDFPTNTVKAVFPTAETITPELREPIERFFKTRVLNQYASSEGAPFIFECGEGNLHLELQSGVFEVLDNQDQPADNGRLVLTSFTTYGTPLIRYDIGDMLILENPEKGCSCGNNNPLVKEILGRIDDYIYSPETGKINLGNVSNTTKNTKGIVRFQVVQNALDILDIYIIADKHYDESDEKIFLKNWRERVGDAMEINLHHVHELSEEKSGKFRIVKNNIKHLIK